MDGARFDELTKLFGARVSRRQGVKLLLAASLGAFLTRDSTQSARADYRGNDLCAHFCDDLFPPGPQRGQCKSEAAHGRGPCYECGPGSTTGQTTCASGCCGPGQGCCGGTCVALNTTSNCGSCGTTCTGSVANGHPICNGGQCDVACNSGFQLVNGACCPMGNVCGGQCLSAPCSHDQCLTCSAESGGCVSICAPGTTCVSGQCVTAATCSSVGDVCGTNGVCTCFLTGGTTFCGDATYCGSQCTTDSDCPTGWGCVTGTSCTGFPGACVRACV